MRMKRENGEGVANKQNEILLVPLLLMYES
jgi:hypothetical protein